MRRLVWTLPCVLACSFDSAGLGDEAGGSPMVSTAPDVSTGPAGETGGTGSSGEPTTGGGVSMSASGTTTGAVDATTGGTTGASAFPDDTSTTSDDTSTTSDDTSTTSDDTTTTLPDPQDTACKGDEAPLLVLVEDAEIEWPMEKEESQAGEGRIASSPVPLAGTVEFTFDVPCDGVWHVWGRVYDGDLGENFNEPDSYFARVHEDDEFVWRYGCETEDEPKNWSWQRVRRMDGDQCDETSAWTLALTKGAHAVRLRNREGSKFGVRAAVARMVLSVDPNYMPTV